jgi:glycosyltransferase involved in cell wall biosynthesis
MKIGIDARFYGSLGKGLGRYTSELIAHLEQIDRHNEYVIFLRKDNWSQYEPQNKNFRKELAEYHWYTWAEQLFYPRQLHRHRLDLMHFPHFNVPLLYRRPFVVTIHDLILLQHPTPRATTLAPLLYRLKYLMYRVAIKHALKRAESILTVSKTSRQEIKKIFPFLEQKQIFVTYGACSPRLHKTEVADQTKKVQPKSGDLFMLYVGNAYPHKNLERLIEAFCIFRQQNHNDWRLILVGAPDYFYKRLQKETAAKNNDSSIIFYGQASDDELIELYRQAQFYVFPSLCEGFGLPPLEAMCSGLPVISSNRSCLPEVLEDAALYFNPEDTADMVRVMTKLVEDNDLRQKLITAGYRQVQKFSWKTTAQKTLDLYERCLHG